MNNLCIAAGTVDVSVVIRIVDSTDGTPETGVVAATAGLDLQYRRELSAVVDLTESDLAALTTAHTDGGILHIGNGYYRVDLPDAACATGQAGVLVEGTVTGMVVMGAYISLTPCPADIRQLLGNAIATPTVAGVPEVDVTHWIGTAAAAPTVAGVPEVDVTHWIGTAASTPTTPGVPEVDVIGWLGTAPAAPTVAGVPEVDLTHWLGTAAAAPTVAGVPEVDATHVAGAIINAATAQLGVNVVTHAGNVGVKKNAALANFMFQMFDSTTHAPVTGKTVTVTRSIDGGAFAAGTLSAVTEVSNGWYRCDFAAADLNGNVIAFRATAATSDDTNVSLVTGP